MNSSTWQQAKAIFDEARGLAISDRAAFVNDKCLDNEELRSEVEKLLASYDSGFLEGSAFGTVEALSENDLKPGQVIGRYCINDLIGSGGMGQVFRADDTELDRPVAFKVLHRDVADDQERVRRFVQEARAASALNHPNILTIHEIGTFEGRRFIVSEFIDGDTLRERMLKGLTAAESIDITCQIAAALEAAHSAGIVHRDIKPENVMIRRDGLVKVLDFGLAKLTEADDQPIDPDAPIASRVHTSPGLIMGTIAYMSPEQAAGKPVDKRTDLWSLGVVFQEMLTGKAPFDGESVTDLVASILKTEAKPIASDDVPPGLQPICQKALAKNKESRYQSAHDLLEDLKGEKKRMEYATQPTPYISVSSTDELKTQLIRPRPTLSAEYVVTTVKQHKFATLFVAALVVTFGIGLSVYRYNGATPPQSGNNVGLGLITDSTTEKDLKFSKLPISGPTGNVGISPDGKYVAYSDKKGINLLNLDTNTSTLLLAIPPADGGGSLTFSPDNKFLYYIYELNADFNSDRIMRVPIQGGKPEIVIEEVPAGGFGFSPDGTKMAYARELHNGSEDVELVLSDSDGSNKRTLTRTSPGGRIEGCGVFSPDGKTITCSVSFKAENIQYFKIIGYNIANGEPRTVCEKQWRYIFGGAWLPNGQLIVSAIDGSSEPQSPPHLWIISPDGQAKAITGGLIGYRGLSSTRDGTVLISRQTKDDNNLWLVPNNDAAKAKQVTTSGELRGGFAATADGRIIIGSNVTGNVDLWIMNNDGSDRKQLTHNGTLNIQPEVSPDNKYIVFCSDRGDGKNRLYRMDLNGQNVKQLTDLAGDIIPISGRISGDGKWVFYAEAHDGKADTIKKVSIDGGESVTITSPPEGWEFNNLDINRSDGRIACGLTRKPNGPREYKLWIISAIGKTPATLIDLPTNLSSRNIRWMPGGKSVAVLETAGPRGTDVWEIPIYGNGRPARITDFRTPLTHNFNWNVDGKFMLAGRGTQTSEPVLIRTTAN
jgi:serine/threonine protein kinase